MEGEINKFFQVWILAIICLTYCYHISARISAGISRLVSLLPILYLFMLLPLKLTTIHLGGFTAFLLVWLTNFKLLLFAFDHGPLFPTPSKLSHFISIACLPIHIKPNSYVNVTTKTHNPSPSLQKHSIHPKPTPHPNLPISRSTLLALKVVLFGMLLHMYYYKQYLNQNLVLVFYGLHIYLLLEIALATCAAPVRAIFGFELEPQFNEPYLATSLQDFWGRRWNLMVTGILRSTVYNPIRRISTRVIGRKWAPLPAVMATFIVSGLMHDIIFYYITRVSPTWEMTSYFVLHGTCLVIEMEVKKALTNRWRLHRSISWLLLVVFLIVTSLWLFFPPLLRNGVNERVISELLTFSNFVRNKSFTFNTALT